MKSLVIALLVSLPLFAYGEDDWKPPRECAVTARGSYCGIRPPEIEPCTYYPTHIVRVKYFKHRKPRVTTHLMVPCSNPQKLTYYP